jgi:RimJ/RimL family protein N-acetyltransferase
MVFVIRDGKIEDSSEIAILLTELGYPATTAFVESNLQQQLSHPDAALLVAVESERVIGFVSLHFIPQLAWPGDFCRISYFCVNRYWHRQGVGAALEAAVQKIAKDRGCHCIEVHCHERRTAAHQFYASRGYSESPKYLIKAVD